MGTTASLPGTTSRYDMVGLGEVMLRLDPGVNRIRNARRFTAWDGGGEYNVVRSASTAFGLRTAVVTALADDEVGRLLEGRIAGAGVSTEWIRWHSADGANPARNGINFTERGSGVRGAVGVSDRAGTAASRLGPHDVDWDDLFGRAGARWLHTGGIFAGLSPTTAETARAAMTAARRHGVIVSFDANYRPSLWNARGGLAAARALCRELGALADVFVGNEFDLAEVAEDPTDSPGDGVDAFRASVDRMRRVLPAARVIASTRRVVRSASRNDWGAFAWSSDEDVVDEPGVDDLEITDRVGGGDSFCSGLIAGLLAGAPLAGALRTGVLHGAHAMTTPGDTSSAAADEVAQLLGGSRPRVEW